MSQTFIYGGIILSAVGIIGLILSSVIFSKRKKKTLERISKDL